MATSYTVGEDRFEIGTVVALKSEPEILMTISNVGENKLLDCQWFDNQHHLNERIFRLDSLVYVR